MACAGYRASRLHHTRLLIQMVAALKREETRNGGLKRRNSSLPLVLQAQALSLDCVKGQWTTVRSGRSSEVSKPSRF